MSGPAPYNVDNGFIPLSLADQDALLGRVLELAGAAGTGGVLAFDLDSTLLDNRPRQARILREYGAQQQLAVLARHVADHWQGWDARIAMANAGMDPDQIEQHLGRFRTFWKDRFFTSEYCAVNRAIAGACAFVTQATGTGARVAYVTGRHEGMREGTRRCFERIGMPMPGAGGVELLMKPTLDEHDDAYKARTYAALSDRGKVVAAFDNEPAHINGYRQAFADATCVHLATDHSMRDIPLAPGIPSIRDFSRV